MDKYLYIDCFTGLKIPNLMLYVAMFSQNVPLGSFHGHHFNVYEEVCTFNVLIYGSMT